MTPEQINTYEVFFETHSRIVQTRSLTDAAMEAATLSEGKILAIMDIKFRDAEQSQPTPSPDVEAMAEEKFKEGFAKGFQARESWEAAASNGVKLITEERSRQITKEGWTPEHDAEHTDGSLAIAAACYALHHTDATVQNPHTIGQNPWPWDQMWWKPADPLKNLVRAGALIAAEIDRLQHKAGQASQPQDDLLSDLHDCYKDAWEDGDEVDRDAEGHPHYYESMNYERKFNYEKFGKDVEELLLPLLPPLYASQPQDAAQQSIPIEGEREQYHAVEFAGYWSIKTEPFYDSGKDILNAEEVGVEQAEKNAVLIAKLLNEYFTRKK